MRHRLRLLLLTLLAPVAALSCREPTGPDDVTLYVIPGQLGIVNDGDVPLYTFAHAEDLLPLIDWMPMVCETCGKVDPGATRYLDVDSIPGGGPGRMVIVFYWRARRGVGDRIEPGTIHSRRIRLDLGIIN